MTLLRRKAAPKNIILKADDGAFTVREGGFDHISHRDYADQLIVVHDGEMANIMFHHQGGALVYGCICGDGVHLFGHQLFDLGCI